MKVHTKIDEAFPIEQALRPVTQANRLLRDYFNARFTVVGVTADDPPTVNAIGRAIDAMREALATTVTPENVRAVIRQMLAGMQINEAVADDLISAVVNRDTLSIMLDGKLPIAAVASAASRCRSAAQPPDAETLLRQCIREHHAMHETLERLDSARITMRGRIGWHR
jgi:ribosomal protein L12E/L44/L45/RPP1/RPP2